MDKYLLSILREVNTIIIPGLGALTITNSATGEIMFMAFLKHDDGKLSEYIAKKENISDTDAKNLIAKYVREIESLINTGEEYSMFEFGSFVKENDEIVFKNWDKKTSTVENSTPKENDNIFIPVEKEVSPEKIEDIKTEIEPEKPKVEKEPTILDKEEKQINEEKLKKLKSAKKDSKKTKKSKRSKLPLIISLVIIVGLGTFFALNYDDLKNNIPFLAEKKTEDLTEDQNDTVIKEENEISTQEEETEIIDEEDNYIDNEDDNSNIDQAVESDPISEDYSTSSNKNYHIIIGSFTDEENARLLLAELKNEHSSAQIISKNGTFKVSIESFETKTKAFNRRKQILNQYENSWVLYSK